MLRTLEYHRLQDWESLFPGQYGMDRELRSRRLNSLIRAGGKHRAVHMYPTDESNLRDLQLAAAGTGFVINDDIIQAIHGARSDLFSEGAMGQVVGIAFSHGSLKFVLTTISKSEYRVSGYSVVLMYFHILDEYNDSHLRGGNYRLVFEAVAVN